MHYDKQLEIEQRLQNVLGLVKNGDYSAAAIAEQLGVSVPTISRSIDALRRRGHTITAVKRGNTWRYIVVSKKDSRKSLQGNRKASA